MKRTILILAIIVIAAPVWAAVTITATHEGCGVVRIDYNSTEPNKVRGFALNISVSDGNIIDVDDYTVGESNATTKGYGIFPATVDVNSDTGDVDDWGSPVADMNDPCTAGELGSNAITLEMGALYSPTGDTSPNAPNNTGTLCRIKVNDNCTVTISANAKRGGVVLSNGNSVSPSIASPAVTVVKYSGSQLADWRLVERPDGWCVGCSNPGHLMDATTRELLTVDPNYRRQCHGDADGNFQGRPASAYWCSADDLNVFIAAWNRPYFDKITTPTMDGIYDETYQVTGGVGYDGAIVPLINADFDHDGEGRSQYRSSAQDVPILVASFNTANKPDPDCP